MDSEADLVTVRASDRNRYATALRDRESYGKGDRNWNDDTQGANVDDTCSSLVESTTG